MRLKPPDRFALMSKDLKSGGSDQGNSNSQNSKSEHLKFGTKKEYHPQFPHFPHGTSFIDRMVSLGQTDEEKDIILIGCLILLSSIMSDVKAIGKSKEIYANLYAFVIGPPASGKGIIDIFYDLTNEIQRDYELEYKEKYVKYKADCARISDKRNYPDKPIKRRFLLSGNTTSAGMEIMLYRNEGKGLILETEGDTISKMFKSEFGDYSDILRRNFHGERISRFRASEEVDIEIQKPRTGVLISGTEDQALPIVKSVENGLFSRFLFYQLKLSGEIIDMYDSSKSIIGKINSEALILRDWKRILDHYSIEFHTTQAQRDRMNAQLQVYADNVISNTDTSYMSVVKRMGTMTIKISMILSVLKMLESSTVKTKIICEDREFDKSFQLVKNLEVHTREVFQRLSSIKLLSGNSWENLLESLEVEFTKEEAVKIGDSISQPLSTVERNLKRLVSLEKIERVKRGYYKKI